jgi:hypothetical protein
VSPIVVGLIALITYGSRAVSLALLPRPGGRLEALLARVPAPIFAGLAALSLVTEGRSLAGGPILLGAVGALGATPARSLPLCLLGGIAGYVLGEALF